MLLHIISDNKFTCHIKRTYDSAFQNQNLYYIVPRKRGPSPKELSLVSDASDVRDIFRKHKNITAVIFNPLMSGQISWLKSIPRNLPVIWYNWGLETYKTHYTLRRKDLYLDKTKSLMKNDFGLSDTKEIRRHLKNTLTRKYSGLSRVNTFVCQFKEEFEYLQNLGIIHKNTKWHFGAVASSSSLVEGLPNTTSGSSIKIGNSSDPCNNHIEAIDWIKKQTLGDQKIIVPLSYGDTKYREMILHYGKTELGDNFVPLIDFMPLADYNKINGQCETVIMNHIRQQALGNLMADIWRGASVHMRENSIYQGFRNWGVELFSCSEENSRIQKLSTESRIRNQNIINEKMSHETIVHAVREMINDAC